MDIVGLGVCSGTTLMCSPFEYLVSCGAAFAVLLFADIEPTGGRAFFFNAMVFAPLQVWDVHVSTAWMHGLAVSVQVLDPITNRRSEGDEGPIGSSAYLPLFHVERPSTKLHAATSLGWQVHVYDNAYRRYS
jgi:hypothetical protein